MKWMLLPIVVVILLSGCATSANEKSDLQSYCPAPEWPSDLTKPKKLSGMNPPPANRFGVTRACLEVQIDEAGKVTGVEVIRADSPDFGSASATVLRQWQFEPARRGSTPVAVTYHVTVKSERHIGPPPKELLERAVGWTRPAGREDEVFVFDVYRGGAEAPPRTLNGCDFLGYVSATVPAVTGGLLDPTALLPTIRARAARKAANTVVLSIGPGVLESGKPTLRGTAFRCGNQPLPPELGEPLR